MDKAAFIGEESVVMMDAVLAAKRAKEGTVDEGTVLVYLTHGLVMGLGGKDAEDFMAEFTRRNRMMNKLTTYSYERSPEAQIAGNEGNSGKLITAYGRVDK